MLSDPPDGFIERQRWRQRAEEDFAALVRSVLRRVVVGAYERFLGTLTADGDLGAFDSIPTEWGAAVRADLSGVIERMHQAGAITAWNSAPAANRLPVSAGENWLTVANDNARDYARAAENRMVAVGQDVWAKVNAGVVQSIGQGMSTEQLKGEIERLTRFSEFRADTIARTEMNAAFVGGAFEGQKALGEYGATHKEWMAVGDARSRPEHLDVSGTVVAFDESFNVDGEDLLYPLDPSGSAGNTVNCRCDILYYYPGDTLPDGTVIPDAVLEQESDIEEPESSDETGDLVESLITGPGSGVDMLESLMSDEEARRFIFQEVTVRGTTISTWRGVDLNGSNDPLLEYIASKQGFTGLPEVVTRTEFEQRIAEPGHMELFRGIPQSDYVKQFRSGEYFGGQGIYGNGTYSSTDYWTAASYAEGQENNVIRLALKPEAKIIAREELDYLMTQETGLTGFEIDEVKYGLVGDEGRYAAARGYDAIRVNTGPFEDFLVILNRTAVIVEEQQSIPLSQTRKFV